MKEIIRVENLSKAYRVGQREQSHDTLFGQLADILSAPVRNLKNLRSLTKFNDQDDPTVHWALRDINFTVNEGEVLGIIGHNGAGKSTLLKILSRVTEPTSGHIRIRGRIGALLEVGTGFHPELTGRENIYMNGTILGMTRKEIDRKLDEIIDFAGVEKFIDTPVKFYSSGMKVRLGFAVAAHLEPEILVIDEVLAVGDAEFQRKCLGKMKDVSKDEGRTVLFVSHNMGAVQELCQRGIVLNKGSLVFSGTQIDAVNYYINNLGFQVNTSVKWDESEAPGDERAKILEITVTPASGKIITFSSGVKIKVVVKNTLEKSLVDVSFNLRYQDKSLLFHHGNYLDKPDKLKKGIYRMELIIPPFILNAGVYSIDVWLGLSNTEGIGKGVRDAVFFEVLNEAIDHIMRPLPGVIRPKLNYQVQYEG
ncbi:polysaccharide ABC transporter ATP-binding protein [Thermaurantimonas aggregans]|uniref:ABC transporter ATP-binding protein n=1 Tax=Thermaurantimonas aggregans TaxID=2173829 RepID=UPI0023F40F4F|nr:ABC transporter ATP-binding protein [Thermaurantimonas aggregans]MCX8148571.1 ABC transporter ATP-binding protein [Thermaurantimonas aggregans]